MDSINILYDEQTHRMTMDDEPTVSTGDIGVDQIVLRTVPTNMRTETIYMVFKVRVPDGRGKVTYPRVEMVFDIRTRRHVATIPKEILQAVQHNPVEMQLRVGTGKRHYSLNVLQLAATKAYIMK